MIISPLSVSTALGLLSFGANGHTFEELRNGLHLTSDKAAMATQFLQHAELLNKSAGNAIFSIANQIYVQQGYQLNKHFQEVAAKYFKSGANSLNFGNSVESAEIINRFVENATNGKIRDLIKPDMLNSDTRSVLVNAIHFKGFWQHRFEKERTHSGEFYVNETATVPAEYMFTTNDFPYAYTLDDLDASALEMRYARSNFSFLILLPKSRNGLSALETKLRRYDLTNIFRRMRMQNVNVQIPKFTTEFEINLNAALKNVSIRSTKLKN